MSVQMSSIGIPVDPAYQQELRVKVAQLLNSQPDAFGGRLPVPFQRKHFSLLEMEDYFVCEKSKGVRYLCLCVVTPKGPATFMIDSKNVFYFVQIPFPLHLTNPVKFQNDTLLDGELVIEKDGEKKTLRYLVSDLMTFNGTIVTQRSFTTRLGILQQDVIRPHKTFVNETPGLLDSQLFIVEMKRQEKSYGMSLILSDLSKSKYESEGLLFTPVRLAYKHGVCQKFLKWEPPDQNTIEFKIKVVYDADRKPHYQLLVYAGSTHKFFDYLTVEPELAEIWRTQSPDTRIGEFRFDSEWMTTVWENGYSPSQKKGGWRFLGFRESEKAFEEDYVVSVLDCIKDAVSMEMLLSHSERIRSNWKEREKLVDKSPEHSRNRHNLARVSSSNEVDDRKEFLRQSSDQSIHYTPERRVSISSNEIHSAKSNDIKLELGHERPNLAISPNVDKLITDESQQEQWEEEVVEDIEYVPPVDTSLVIEEVEEESGYVQLPETEQIPIHSTNIPKEPVVCIKRVACADDDYDSIDMPQEHVQPPSYIEEDNEIGSSQKKIDNLPKLMDWTMNDYLPAACEKTDSTKVIENPVKFVDNSKKEIQDSFDKQLKDESKIEKSLEKRSASKWFQTVMNNQKRRRYPNPIKE